MRINTLTYFIRYMLMLFITSAFELFTLHAQNSDPDILEFGFITDIHQFGSTADIRSANANVNAFVDYCNQHPTMQFAAFGGDFYNDYDTNHEEGLACLHQSVQCFQGLRLPFYTTRGNHDCNGKCKKGKQPDNSQIITDREYYDLFSPLSEKSRFYHPEGIVADPENPYGNYYYRDFDQQRVRVIVLNNYDRDSLEIAGYHGQQLKWLTETALDFTAKEDIPSWSFLIIGHAFTIDRTNSPVSRLLHAYVRGQDFFDVNEGVAYGCHFRYRPKARFIGFIYGHYHEDGYANWDGYNMITVNRGYATGSEVGRYEECFDHFIINTRDCTIEERRIGRGQTRTYSYNQPLQLSPGFSFPEAEGMGRFTTGGRQGRLIHVTNLEDNGPGSLRSAIQEEGPRTIVFDVSGTIHLDSALIIRHSDLTIAGHSSSAPGITLAGAPLVVDADQVIIRYLTVSQLYDEGYHLRLMLDHITAHSDTATAIAIRHASNVTVQHSVISSDSELQPALLAGGFRASYIYNHIKASPLAIAFSDREGENRWVQVARNLISSWKYRAMYGGGHQGEFSIHENYFVPDSATRHFRILDVAEDGTARYWLRLNEMKGMEQYTRNNKELVNDCVGNSYNPLPQDTALRPFMHPVARPHSPSPAPSCLVVAAFPSSIMDGQYSAADLQNKILREAGSQYRPSIALADSIQTDNARSTAQVLSYLDHIVEPERSIVVLFEGDVHCRIDGYPYFLGLRDPIASDSAYVALVSCGDFLQGGLAGSITNGQAIIDVMRHIPYDAITLGTHDFDYSHDHVRKLLNQAQFPIISANLRNVKTDTLVLPPYIIRQYGHRKVAYVGITTPSTQITNNLYFTDASGNLLFDFDPTHVYQRVQQAVNEARHEGADYVVVLSQLGFEPDRFGVSAQGLIAATTGIDAVLDGHSHSVIPQLRLSNRIGQEVLYAQAGYHFSHVGKLVIDPDGRMLTELIPRQQMRFRDPLITQEVDSIKNLFMGSAEDYAGRSLVKLLRPKEYDVTAKDSSAINAGNLVCDAMRWATGTDIAWLNAGSIRQSLPSGEITRGDILEMAPYPNQMVTIDLLGAQLVKVMRLLVRNLDTEGAIFSPISGIQVKLHPKRHNRYKLDAVTVYDRAYSRYVPIDPQRIYHVVTTDYCLSIVRRSKFFFRNNKLCNTEQMYNEAIFQYINLQLNGLVESTPELREERCSIHQ